MTYRECYETGRSILKVAGVSEADLDARLLLEYICGTDRNELLVHGERRVSEEQEYRYRDIIKKRAKRIPLQYLTGYQEFMGLDFLVNESVLIPRQDTEILVEEVLKNLRDGFSILDMCTGSGCILLSLLRYSNDCTGVGVDLSGEALEVAAQNAERLGIEAQWLNSDLFDQVCGSFEIIVSNPPYIRTDVIAGLEPEVRDHEPLSALDGASDGLSFYRRITADSTAYLKGGGMLFFEIGYDQAEAVRQLMERNGFLDVRVVKDYAGLDRVVFGTKP